MKNAKKKLSFIIVTSEELKSMSIKELEKKCEENPFLPSVYKAELERRRLPVQRSQTDPYLDFPFVV